MNDGTLDASVVEGTQVDGGLIHHPSRVVFQAKTARNGSDDNHALPAPAGQQYWTINSTQNQLNQETFAITADQVQGDITWSLTSVEGPGAFAVWDGWSSSQAGRPVLGTREGHEHTTHEIWPGTTADYNWGFSEPGVYCIGLRWDATLADGTPTSAEKALTFVAGTDIDPTTVTPCAPEDPDPDPTPTPTATATATPTVTPTPTPTITPTPTGTSTPTIAPTPTITPTSTATPTVDPTPDGTGTPGPGASPPPGGLPDTGAGSIVAAGSRCWYWSLPARY